MKTMKTGTIRKITLGLTAAAIAMGGVAYAQGGKGPAQRMDTDGNGSVSRAEAQAMATKMFDRLDANHDGKIDAADRALRQTERRTKMFEKLDANHDGSISKDEFLAAKGPMDGKGPMGGPGGPGDDRGPGMDSPPPPPPGEGGPDMAGGPDGGPDAGPRGPGGPGCPGMDRPGKGGKHGMGHGHKGMGMMMFEKADTNHDGAVTKAEAMAAVMTHFDEVDTNKDGQISADERKAAHEKMRAEFQAHKADRQAPPAPPAN